MELQHEQFEGMKELATISTQIAAGTAALAQLKASEETYMTEREARLVSRLQKTLADSIDLITAIGQNHEALVGYRNEVGDFLTKVLSLIQSLDDCIALVESAGSELDERITKHEEDVQNFRAESARTASELQAERTELSGWRDRLGEDERKLNDRRATLERTLNRIKK